MERGVSLAPLTTFGIGGKAKFFVRVKILDELRESLDYARDQHQRMLILGGGSNVLISDEGFDGLVIKIELSGVEQQGEMVVAAAGEQWDGLVAGTIEAELWGLENLSGIPGSVGGAVVQNIGAYGQALSEVVQWVEVFDTESGKLKTLQKNECVFEYRDSFFKHHPELVVVRAAFELSSVPQPILTYKDVATRLGNTASLAEIRKAIIAIRKDKFPDLAVEGTAGSFFKNPIVSAKEATRLKDRYPEMPLFVMPETQGVKVPIAWLLDKKLKLNGFSLGSVRLFERQPLVIAANRGARASEVRALAEKIKKEVQENFGIILAEEVKMV